jgi:membrane protein DedA with SNARE-associated domain
MANWIIAFIEQHGYIGIALLMLAENIFPPVPSELIMPFAGFAAARGSLELSGVVVAGIVGSVAGTLPWYWAGHYVGCQRLKRFADRHGRWVTVSSEDIDRAERWFQRHGGAAVALGRLVPAVRSVISAPAGIARMPLPSFLLWSSVGTGVWTAALAAVGLLLEDRYEQVGRWLNPVATAVVVISVAGYALRVVRFHRR